MNNLPSKIFIDGGEPRETEEAKKLLGFLNGQTTNPTLIAKNLAERHGGKKLSQEDALNEYKRIVQAMSTIIPRGSISIQVFANQETQASEMLRQARERIQWIPNGSIKFPCITEGLKAAEVACREMPINITLAFSQSQGASVYEATRQAKFPVFISPFVGRLDDRGENGMEVVKNILRMYKKDAHAGGPESLDSTRDKLRRRVEVLTASVRTPDHIFYALSLGSDIITIPFKVFKMWQETGFKTPEENYVYPVGQLKPIAFREDVILGKPWQEYDLSHDLTATGINRFFSDWNSVVG